RQRPPQDENIQARILDGVFERIGNNSRRLSTASSTAIKHLVCLVLWIGRRGVEILLFFLRHVRESHGTGFRWPAYAFLRLRLGSHLPSLLFLCLPGLLQSNCYGLLLRIAFMH